MMTFRASDALQHALAGDPDVAVVNTIGTLGGECFRATCHKIGADWFHRGAGRYYCADCAADINLACRLKGEPPICVKQGRA